MPRILTVDDSRAIRLIVSKQLAPLGWEIGEAEDGNDGLKQLAAAHYDLVILDVTMPNLDGPGMLGKMREGGDKTPVLMLTSESKTAIVSALLKMGIEDYVLKPFKGDELKAKVLKALKLPADYAPAAGSAAGGAQAASEAPRALVIDDMDNVHKKIRSIIPTNITVDTALNAQDGLASCRSNKYKMILIDGELPDVALPSLTKQLRILQPGTVLVAMALRTANNITQEMRAQGFDDVLLKPFANENVESLVEKCFAGSEELIIRKENSVTLGACHGHDDQVQRYFQRLGAKMRETVSQLAEGCYDSAVVDASKIPLSQPLLAAQFVLDLVKATSQTGITVRVVGPAELAKMAGGFEETKGMKFFSSVEEAKQAAA